jgi:hypothetical protein
MYFMEQPTARNTHISLRTSEFYGFRVECPDSLIPPESLSWRSTVTRDDNHKVQHDLQNSSRLKGYVIMIC